MGGEVTQIHMAGGRVAGASYRGRPVRQATGDWFIGALPVERMAPLVTPPMVAAEPALANLAPLSNSVQWMNGIQYYLTRMCRSRMGTSSSSTAPGR